MRSAQIIKAGANRPEIEANETWSKHTVAFEVKISTIQVRQAIEAQAG
jgi:hypothetical protein